MKRYFLLFLSFVVIIASFPVAASASSFDPAQEQLGNFFDYTTTDQRYFEITSDYLPIYFGLPTQMYVSYVELVVYSSVPIDRVVCYGREAEVIKKGNNYRIIWNVGSRRSNWAFNIYFTSSTTGWLYVNDASFSSNITSTYAVSCDVQLYERTRTTTYSYTGSDLDIPCNKISNNDHNESFTLGFPFSSVKFYDLLNISIIFYDLVSINSVTVGSADQYVFPYELTYVDVDESLGLSGTWTHLKVSIDLSDVRWSVADPNLTVFIDGYYYFNYYDSGSWYPELICKIAGIHGYVFSDNGDPVIFWFRKTYAGLGTWFNTLFDKFDDIILGRDVDQSAADSFNDSINDQSDELEDLSSDLNSVTRPPLSDVNLSSSGMVNSNTIVLATTGIGSIMSNSIILRVLLMALTFALAGFILYGKR